MFVSRDVTLAPPRCLESHAGSSALITRELNVTLLTLRMTHISHFIELLVNISATCLSFNEHINYLLTMLMLFWRLNVLDLKTYMVLHLLLSPQYEITKTNSRRSVVFELGHLNKPLSTTLHHVTSARLRTSTNTPTRLRPSTHH